MAINKTDISHFNDTNAGNVSITQLPSTLPKAEQYRNSITRYDTPTPGWSEPKYKCPKCGEGMCRNNMRVLTTNPPKYEYKCKNCGLIEYQFG